MKKVFFILVSILLINSISYAEQRQFATIYGVGVNSCAEYFSARESKNQGMIYQYRAWMDGYFSATSMWKPDFNDENITSQKRVALLMWLDNYCRENPLKSFVVAIQALEQELVQR